MFFWPSTTCHRPPGLQIAWSNVVHGQHSWADCVPHGQTTSGGTWSQAQAPLVWWFPFKKVEKIYLYFLLYYYYYYYFLFFYFLFCFIFCSCFSLFFLLFYYFLIRFSCHPQVYAMSIYGVRVQPHSLGAISVAWQSGNCCR